MPREYSHERYLAAKRTVDDRAVNRQVLDELDPALGSASRIVEVGAGIGTMVQRLLEWDRLGDRVTYTLVDTDADALAAAADRLPAWAESRGYTVTESPDASVDESPDASVDDSPDASVDESPDASVDESPDASVDDSPDASVDDSPDASVDDSPDASVDDSPDESTNGATAAGKRSAGVTAFELRSPDRRVRIEAVVADATVYLHDANPDLVVGCAFLDLLEPSGVDALLEAIPKGCVCYFPITFDGGTWFGPETDDADGFDELVAERYHEDMRRRRDPGDPHAGRRLLSRASTDHDLVAAGASDWIVTPVDDGAGDDGCGNGDSDGGGDWYPADEAYFLHYIVDTVSGALADDPAVDDDRLAAWADRRHAAIDAGALVYVAHQLDVALRV